MILTNTFWDTFLKMLMGKGEGSALLTYEVLLFLQTLNRTIASSLSSS